MTTEQDTTLVFKDAAGEYYLLPLATLRRGQVPAERKAELERLIAEHQDDAQGHAAGMAGIYQAWADQGKFLKDLSDSVGRPRQYGDAGNTRLGPTGAP